MDRTATGCVARGEGADEVPLSNTPPAANETSAPLSALGHAAMEMAHELNNLLGAMRGFAVALERHIPPDSAAQKAYCELLRTCDRGSWVTRKVLELASHRSRPIEPVDLREVLAGMEPLLRHVLPDRILMVCSVADGLPPVLARRSDLELLVLNLVMNARDAIEGRGRIEIRATSQRGLGEDDMAPPVLLTVRDTGRGMDADVLNRAFDPFFTTKPRHSGAGLGLTIVRETLRGWDASIGIESAVGAGTLVTVRFRTAGQQSSAERLVLLCMPPGAARELTAQLLRRGGSQVLEVDCMTHAYAHARERLRSIVAAVVGAAALDCDEGIVRRVVGDAHQLRAFILLDGSQDLAASVASWTVAAVHAMPSNSDLDTLVQRIESGLVDLSRAENVAFH